MTTPIEIINREHWLNELVARLGPMLESHGKKMPKFRISCGFPVTRARPSSSKTAHRIGECWGADASADGTHEIFISPILGDALQIADVALHEMIHAALPPGTGHKAPFARLAKAVGLEGKPTATHAGDELKAKLQTIIDELGEYPHAALDASGRKKQTTRLLKVMCPECGYTARVTRTWIEEAGNPICPQCNTEFVEPEDDQAVDNPLLVAEQSIEFALKDSDDRFTVRLSKKGKVGRWYVLDYGVPADFKVPEPARVTPAESRQDALDLIDSIREGLLTYEELEETDDSTMIDDADVEPDEEEDWRDLQFLAEDEDEFPDNLDSLLTPEEAEEYERNQRGREEAVEI